MSAVWNGHERRSGDDRRTGSERRGRHQPAPAGLTLVEQLDDRRRTEWANAASARALRERYRHLPDVDRALGVAEAVHHAVAVAYEQALELARREADR
jgi:hypothetical protein